MRRLIPLCAALTVTSWAVGHPLHANADPLDDCKQFVTHCDKDNYKEDKCEDIGKNMKNCDADTKPGTVCKLPLSKVTPTQIAVGERAAECKSKKLKDKEKDEEKGSFEKGLTRYLLEPDQLVPTVIGPNTRKNDRFFITDRHHLSYALRQLDKEHHVYACIIANKHNDKDNDEFWRYMVKKRQVWLSDEEGRAITVDKLRETDSLDDLTDSPFRTWSAWVLDRCGYFKTGSDCLNAGAKNDEIWFIEFRWANYLEKNMPDLKSLGDMNDKELEKSLRKAIKLARSDQAYLEELPGYIKPDDNLADNTAKIKFKDGCLQED